MPTGYTAPVEDGTITEVKDYAAACARAFGVFMHQRDESFNGVTLRYPDAPDTSYYTKAFADAQVSLRNWQAAYEEDKYAEWSSFYKDALVSRAESKARHAIEHSRYQSMLAQVQAIDVPSKLDNFKKFMIEQIEVSDTHDDSFSERCYGLPEYVEWCESKNERVLRDVVYYEEQLNKEKARYIESCEYIDLMVQTFGFEVEK